MAVQPTDTKQNVLSAVDYFKAKLQFEQTPNGLSEVMKLPSLMVLDVRDKDSYAKEHVQGAKNMPLEEIHAKADSLPHDKTIVTYCWNLTCALATKAALELAHRGFKVQELIGGIEEWKKKGFPVEASSPSMRKH